MSNGATQKLAESIEAITASLCVKSENEFSPQSVAEAIMCATDALHEIARAIDTLTIEIQKTAGAD